MADYRDEQRGTVIGTLEANGGNVAKTDHPGEPWSLLPDMERISAALRQRTDALDPDAA